MGATYRSPNDYIVHCTVYSVQCTVYTVHCTLYSVQCTLYTVHCTLYTVHITIYTFNVNCIVYSVNCKLYNTYWLVMKRSRARVTIGGQCVLLQNSLKIGAYYNGPKFKCQPTSGTGWFYYKIWTKNSKTPMVDLLKNPRPFQNNIFKIQWENHPVPLVGWHLNCGPL